MTPVPEHWPWPPIVWGGRRTPEAWKRIERARLAGPVAAANEFRVDAEADGWIFAKTYGHEPVEHAFKGRREGYVLLGIARPGSKNLLPTGSISAWGPDGLALSPIPVLYPGLDVLKTLARHCPECGAKDVDTVRVAFANRCCEQCAPKLRAKLEKPGWTK